jgi:hypothetical protein
LGDAFVNVARSHGVGFNACTLENLQIQGTSISFHLKTARPGQQVAVRFAGIDPRASYTLALNGGKPVTVSGQRLASEGFRVAP